ncbi:MAG: M20/M25/M40 family metallo-hydrolase [Candidatus Tectomicrobia bacterium]|nr:M20/M25/M40 family metallo-hydrolase [Candidatus Tectomicrobia bacterium]
MPGGSVLSDITGQLHAGPALWRTFHEICDLGPRFSGTPSEAAMADYLERCLRGAGLADVRRWEFGYTGWRCTRCELSHPGAPPGWEFRLMPLVYSAATPPGGVELETADLGRGTAEDFRRAGRAVPGRAVIVDAEYSFSVNSLHRRRKFLPAVERGAAAFLLVNARPGRFPVTGSTSATGSPIPAVGLSREDGMLLRRLGGKVRLDVRVETAPARAANLIASLPGRGGGRKVVLSAHYDGHDCGESALDNATGCAAALEIARHLAARRGRFANDLEVHFYTAEEWGLQGSRAYVNALSEQEVAGIALNLNLDVVAGSSKFTFLCNGFADLADWVRGALADEPARWEVSEWVANNSDHANYVARGVPAVRILAGLDENESNCGFHLSPADTSDKVRRADLTAAAGAAARVLLKALEAEGPVARTRTKREAERLMPHYGFAPPPVE